jgi:two-component system OmpR family sensor kinase
MSSLSAVSRRLFASARSRILASYLVLLLFSTIVGTVALRQVLLGRAGERVDDALVQETEEFRQLARTGRDPRTGRRVGDDVRKIFDVFLLRNVPAEREAFYTFVNGRPYRERYAPSFTPVRVPEIDAVAKVRDARGGEA